MEDEKTSNVIKFPVENSRLDVTKVPTTPQEVMKEIDFMRKAFFSEVADRVLDDVLRSISVLDLQKSKYETFNLETTDTIMIKESVMAALYRIVGMVHPLHEIGENEIIPTMDGDSDDMSWHIYKFRSEEDDDDEDQEVI